MLLYAADESDHCWRECRSRDWLRLVIQASLEIKRDEHSFEITINVIVKAANSEENQTFHRKTARKFGIIFSEKFLLSMLLAWYGNVECGDVSDDSVQPAVALGRTAVWNKSLLFTVYRSLVLSVCRKPWFCISSRTFRSQSSSAFTQCRQASSCLNFIFVRYCADAINNMSTIVMM